MTVGSQKTKAFSGNEIREMFLRFFEGKGHKRVRSSSLVPHGDPTLLFTNAGMNQFKDVFLGLEKRDYARTTTAQKCVRAGGKHNDLENVGFTKRHHTFFEMLGNFSFGDYFKKEAIAYAWELVTSPQWFSIDKNKLYVTVFGGAEVSGNHLGVDEEAKGFWLEQKVPSDRIFAIPGLKENFWQMGDTGPCGPCSELHYDMGPAASEQGHTDCKFPCDCGRYVEIWNLVFMQFNKYWACERPGASLDEGVFDPRIQEGVKALKEKHEHLPTCFGIEPLPKPCVDTGMGLERTAAVLQGVVSNYDTDLFMPLTKRAAELCGVDFAHEEKLEEGKGGAASLRVIADHARAATFLVSDGVSPSNEGRGYVLRKIIRRAVRHADSLFPDRPIPIMEAMAHAVCDEMKTAYPELGQNIDLVGRTLGAEEDRFLRTISRGLSELYTDLDKKVLLERFEKLQKGQGQLKAELSALAAKDRVKRVSAILEGLQDPGRGRIVYRGEDAFRLYDTFGLPLDFIQEVCHDLKIEFDQSGFDKAMKEQRTRARASWKGGAKEAANPAYAKLAETFKTEPDFYHGTSARDCRIEAIILTGGANRADTKSGPVRELKPGESGEVVLDRTVIYAESGGQVADIGAFYDNSESQELAEVKGAFYPVAGLIAHKVVAKETLRVGDRVAVVADAERHARVIRNHTGTHLVHAALRNILGTHVKQSGSENAPERLRFDFSHFAHVDAEELRDIEQQVNDEIRLNTQIETNVTSLENALASGALAFFGDKYPESNVRVVTIPDPRSPRGFYSKELCGGTHVQRAGDIGVLKIVSEESVSAGVRRIFAVTGIGALEHYQHAAELVVNVAGNLNVAQDDVLSKLEKLTETVKQLEKELETQKRKGALGQLDDLAARVQVVKGIKVIAAEVQNVDREGLRQLVDSLRQKLGSGVVALGMPENGKVALIAGVTKDLTAKVHAGKLIGALAEKLGGKGGGRPDLAEAGGKDTAGLKTALQTVPSYIEGLL
jgi:alanyl-tRNA synthetase